MTTQTLPSSAWRTASFADHTDSNAVDISALGQHVSACRQGSRSRVALRRGVELIHGFLSGRFVTTLTMIAVIIGLSSLAL